jgi:hypothetical protein
MDFIDIARQRIINQQLAGTNFNSPDEIVSWMGAMQAQDYPMSKWAIGVRLPGSTDQSIEQTINQGKIIRMHMMRPTWHLVSSKDVRWLLALTAPHLFKSMRSRWKALGLVEKDFKRTNSIIEKSLNKNKLMTRAEVVDALHKNKINPDTLQLIHIMFNAELSGIICSGPMRGKQFTYALLEERIPGTTSLKRDEALAELAARYFTSHGPASVQDFKWWSGLPAALAQRAVEMIKSKLKEIKTSTQTLMYAESGFYEPRIKPVYFLPAFDEFMISYKDRSASIAPRFIGKAITSNGIFRPIIVRNGQVIGTWSREHKNDTVIFDQTFFARSDKLRKDEMAEACLHYNSFITKRG